MADPTWALIAQGKQFHKRVSLTAARIRIGSGPDNDLVLPPGAGVAERHASVEGKPGKYFIRDLETREGVLVNGRRSVLHRLQLDDRIQLGAIMLFVVEEGRAAQQAQSPAQPPAQQPAQQPAPAHRPPPTPTPRSLPRPDPKKLAAGAGPPAAEARPPAAPRPAPPPRPSDRLDLPLNVLLREAREKRASDVHLIVDVPVLMRINGTLERLRTPLSASAVEALAYQACSPEQRARFERTGDLDFCYELGAERYRVNLCFTRLGTSATFRIVRDRLATPEELGLPAQADRLITFAQGLVLITGPLSSGKTTSLMALADLINRTRHDHIISIEDPIEFLLPPDACQVSQRELNRHTASFATALRAALREDPDVIVIGDLRDHETARLAISAAETGHLVLASMNAMNAAKSIDKLLDMFPAGEQAVVRTTVSESLRGILCQRLLPGAGGEQVVATELLFNSVAIGNLIREGKTSGLKSAMQMGRAQGMHTLQASVDELLRARLITPATAEMALAL